MGHLCWPCRKIGQGHYRVIIYINFVELLSLMLLAKFQNHESLGSGEEDFKGFCYLQTWRPSWSCDLDYLYKLLFSFPQDTPHEVWL